MGDVQIVVRPKIPMAHIVFLMSFSATLPRFVRDDTRAAASHDFLELIARWFMHALEDVLRRELVRDYYELSEDLLGARGQINALATSENYYAGRLSLRCEFEEFDLDTPLNRVLKAGLISLSTNSLIDRQLRRSASLVSRRLDVGLLRPGDLAASEDRRTAHYRDALILAKLLIGNEARAVELGGCTAWTFLMPTPRPVESGIREVLKQSLAPHCTVTNRSLVLKPANLTVNPDVVIEPNLAIADIKYKLCDGEWMRSDLYQSVAFAAAYAAKRSAIITFKTEDIRTPPELYFDDISVRHLAWNATERVTPAESAEDLVRLARQWLGFSERKAATILAA